MVNYCNVQGGFSGTGNINNDPCFADTSSPDVNEWDYHLKSEAGRWDPANKLWVSDKTNSPCIDAGDPNSHWTKELWPHGKQINMGVYGGTPEASMSLSPAGNIVDFNNDGFVYYEDVALFGEMWLSDIVPLSQDINRNGLVNFADWAEFAGQWLWEE